MYLDSIPANYFDKYDIIFIGEQHKAYLNEVIEIKLISKIKDQKTRICFEASFDVNIPIEKTFNKTDTANYNVSLFNNYGREPILFKYFYNNLLMPRAIDIFNVNSFSKKEIFNLYTKKEMPMEIKNDINQFMKIGPVKFPFTYKNTGKYIKFIDNFKQNKKIHANYLGKDSITAIEYFEALDATLYAENDMSKDAPVESTFREEFMFKMLRKEIDKDLESKIISINGHIHIILDNKSSWIRNPKYLNIASLTKTQYPNKTIGSIYLLNDAVDIYFRKEYPEEYRYISDHTLMNNKYIIEINESNTPFKNLVGKYTHIVVY